MHESQISDARDTNVEPMTGRMGPVNVCSSRRAEQLHAVIAGSQQSSRQDVDKEMIDGVLSFGILAGTSIYHGKAVHFLESRCQVDH